MEKNEGVNFGKNLTYTRERFAHAAIYRIRTFAWNKSGGENLPNSWKLIREQRREIRKDFHFFSSINAFLEAVSIRLEELFIRKKNLHQFEEAWGQYGRLIKNNCPTFRTSGKWWWMVVDFGKTRESFHGFFGMTRHQTCQQLIRNYK